MVNIRLQLMVLLVLDGLVDACDAPRDLQSDPRMAWKWLQSSVASHLTTTVCVSLCERLASECKLGLILNARVSQGEY